MVEKTYVVGVGMTPFEKPGARESWDYPDMVREAGRAALEDAGIAFGDVQQAVAGYVYGESTSGQRAIYELGTSGIPIYNVNNNCSTGSSALMLGRLLVETGGNDCVLVVGFEKMERGSLRTKYDDRTLPLDRHYETMAALRGRTDAPLAPQIFGNAGREHMERYGSTERHFAWIAEKNHRHSVNNPRAQFQDPYTLDEILASREIHAPLTKLQCSPTSDGAAAAVLASESFVRERGLQPQAIEILAQTMTTDTNSTFASGSAIDLVGYEMTQLAAARAFEEAGCTVDDVDVIELHDCFSTNELLTYEALGMAAPGRGASLIDNEETTYGGRWVVNPSGGLISKGHPLGATGVAQCAELCWQLRGVAGARQVSGAELALQHNIGLGGAAVVSLYANADVRS
jgi:acetyl-CoA acetyltransferase